jgi:hypothetical protein
MYACIQTNMYACINTRALREAIDAFRHAYVLMCTSFEMHVFGYAYVLRCMCAKEMS